MNPNSDHGIIDTLVTFSDTGNFSNTVTLDLSSVSDSEITPVRFVSNNIRSLSRVVLCSLYNVVAFRSGEFSEYDSHESK